jgi:hypothetical protein
MQRRRLPCGACRSSSTDLRFFVIIYSALMLALAGVQHFLLEPPSASFFTDLYLVHACLGLDSSQHLRWSRTQSDLLNAAAAAHPALLESRLPRMCPPCAPTQVSRWVFGEELPSAAAPGGQQLLAVLTALTGLLGFALILALVEQVRR